MNKGVKIWFITEKNGYVCEVFCKYTKQAMDEQGRKNSIYYMKCE